MEKSWLPNTHTHTQIMKVKKIKLKRFDNHQNFQGNQFWFVWCVCVCVCVNINHHQQQPTKKWKKNKQISDTWNNMTILVGRVIIIISHFHSFRFFPFFLVTSRSSSSFQKKSWHFSFVVVVVTVPACICVISGVKFTFKKKKNLIFIYFFSAIHKHYYLMKIKRNAFTV